MNKGIVIAIGVALATALGILLMLSVRHPDVRKGVGASIPMLDAVVGFDEASIREHALEHLDPQSANALQSLEAKLKDTQDPLSQVALYKELSAFWYQRNEPLLSAIAAERVAFIEKADSSWSVAGALFYNANVGAVDSATRVFAAKKALNAFETASQLAPQTPEHQVNLALVYAENPQPDNPMKAVMLLRELEQKYPDNPAVYNALGRLAIKTSQWDRAIQRLEKAYALDPKNPNTPCLLAQAYSRAGRDAEAKTFADLCKRR